MIIKCKMCGGDITFNPGDTYGQCEYCGGTSTIPKADDEQRLNRFNRANHYRRLGEYDKAIASYDKILEEDDSDAEAHWGAALSRYGIEYVEDPATKKRIPTCHRVQVESILADADYLAALKYAPDTYSRNLYEEQAKEIAEIQKGILAISANEKPYDVFICYKETDENGKRTRDSALAQDVYYGLAEQGYKVFFSRITLEDKLGQEYEPYIFAALNSARVMVVIGTKPEYFNAVWVKNEWSRYLHLMKNDRKRLLIPCYRDMDAYELPEELSNLQSQDMSKIGFMQDLIRGIRKVLEPEQAIPAPAQQTIQAAAGSAGSPGVNNLMKRVRLFMEDDDFENASEYLDRVLDFDAECSEAYAARVCVEFGIQKEAGLAETTFLYEDNTDWQKAVRFANPQQKSTYEGYLTKVKERVNRQIRDYAYDCAIEMAVNPKADRSKLDAELNAYKQSCTRSESARRADGSRRQNGQRNEESFRAAVQTNEPGDVPEQNLKTASSMFAAIQDDEAAKHSKECLVLAEQARQKAIYQKAVSMHNQQKNSPRALDEAAKAFLTVPTYKDASEKAGKCREEAEYIRSRYYSEAVAAMKDAGDSSVKWDAARKKLAESELNDYRDINELRSKAARRYSECLAAEQEAKRQTEEYRRKQQAAAAAKKKRNTILGVLTAVVVVAAFFVVIKVIIPGNNYQNAIKLRADGKFEEAIKVFTDLGDYKDVAMQIQETKYQQAKSIYDTGDYVTAFTKYQAISGYKDVDSLLKDDGNLLAAREAKLSSYKTVGSTVTFGRYEQDNNTANGQEDIEWIVLDVQNGKSLLLSKYGLDIKPYNTEKTIITWEKCTLRNWLNNDFIRSAFSTEEQSAILTTTVDNSKSQGYSGWSTDLGNNTQDQIFLLSYAEANRYLGVTYDDSNNTKSRVAPTAYAKANGASTSSSKKTTDGSAAGWWWLRSPGFLHDRAASVGRDGSLIEDSVSSVSGCVRPAFWLNLESDIF